MDYVNELLNCPICLDRFKEPKILPCHHSFCNICIINVIQDRKIECPTCRAIHDVTNGIQNDFRTNQLLDCCENSFAVSSEKENQIPFIKPSAPQIENCHQDLVPYNVDEKSYQRIINKDTLTVIIVIVTAIIFLALIVCIKSLTEWNKISCKESQFRNGTECLEKRHYNENCDASFQCDNKQLLACIKNKCYCHQNYSYFDFDIAKCKSKLNENSKCSASYQCLSSMLCQNELCKCDPHEYFNERSLQCLNKTTHKTPCHSSRTCSDDIGLKCIEKKCQCDPMTQFWSSINERCEDYYKYGQLGCSQNSDCSQNLVCNLNPIDYNCSCPILSKYGMCDCKMSNNEQYYWNGLKCIERHHSNENCEKTYECDQKQLLLCINKTCQCQSQEFYNPVLLRCLNKTTHNEYCNSSNACKDDIGLKCIEKKCQCDPMTQFWSSINERCEDYYKYGQLGCSQDSDCSQNLVCNLNPIENNCSCPILSKYGMCDCKMSNNEQYYWNGEACSNSLDNLICKFDYECKKPKICLQKVSLCSSDFKFSSILRNNAINIKFKLVFNLFLVSFRIFIF